MQKLVRTRVALLEVLQSTAPPAVHALRTSWITGSGAPCGANSPEQLLKQKARWSDASDDDHEEIMLLWEQLGKHMNQSPDDGLNGAATTHKERFDDCAELDNTRGKAEHSSTADPEGDDDDRAIVKDSDKVMFASEYKERGRDGAVSP